MAPFRFFNHFVVLISDHCRAAPRVPLRLRSYIRVRYSKRQPRGFVAEERRDDRWSQLHAEARAKVLRVEGSLALGRGDLDAAQTISEEADTYAPQDEPRLGARIASERIDPEAGLSILGEPRTLAGRQLRAALLLGAGRRAEARDILLDLDRETPNEPETLRLLALERLGVGERDEALRLIQVVEERASSWTATLRSAALIRYAHSLSPSLPSEWLLAPNPVHSDLVRSDPVARAHLVEALRRLDRIPVQALVPDDDLWRLAILSNIHGRREDAIALAERLLRADPTAPIPIAWSIMRGFEVDLVASRSALEAAYRGGADLPSIRVLGMLLSSQASHAEGADFLEAYLERQGKEEQQEAALWASRLRGGASDESSEVLRRAQEAGDWTGAQRLLDDLLSQDPPKGFALAVAESLAAAEQWAGLASHVDAFLKFETAAGVRLASYAAAHAGGTRKGAAHPRRAWMRVRQRPPCGHAALEGGGSFEGGSVSRRSSGSNYRI